NKRRDRYMERQLSWSKAYIVSALLHLALFGLLALGLTVVVKQQEQRRLASLSDAKRTEMLARAEAEIAMAEAELKGLEFEMNRPEVQGDPEKSAEIAELYAAKEQEIEERYARWEALAD
ncbi:MAG: ABC transporter C-terminal domain-containing protein, partial [Selenomonas sp.]